MQWLNSVVNEILNRFPEDEIIVSSGVSPSGTYHLGTLREVLTAEAITYELKKRLRKARHIHVVDDLDIFRKVPINVSSEFEQYLGKPLCDIPAPDGSSQSYADFYLQDLLRASDELHLEMDIIRAHEKYRAGFFTEAIEKALEGIVAIKQIFEAISGHKVDKEWSPIQVIEDGYLKNREFLSINKVDKTLVYKGKDGVEKTIHYDKGEVKLNWRIDWPARWWLLKVKVEPFGRDHATKGGSYDTGSEIVQKVFASEPPVPLPYNFINRTGQTKKMSKSAGDVVTATDLLRVLPPEVVWFFVVRHAPDKQLFFDEDSTLIRLMDEFGELLAKPNKTKDDRQLIDICLHGITQPTVSRIPFSHLVASYQASLKDINRTLEVIQRTEYAKVVTEDAEIIKSELKYIDEWLKNWAPEEVKFSLLESVDPNDFTEPEKVFLQKLGDKVAESPADADGSWFHNAIYSLKDELKLDPKELFGILYKAVIGKTSGPRAGYFLSILPRDWLMKRLRLEA
ncbi:MAG TPA: lysine--tRNA ligase [Candidatus Saccharimonadales bacterium]|nr:lysine--tRNA ligase [Candidatus Saccharimonadales bacterium]